MHRLSNGKQIASLPTPAAVYGTPGYATTGNPGTGAGRAAAIDDLVTLGNGMNVTGTATARIAALEARLK